MSSIDKKALEDLAKNSKNELEKAAKRWRDKRVTKLVRLSIKSHQQIRKLSKAERMTMSKTLDFIIKKFNKHHNLYELD